MPFLYSCTDHPEWKGDAMDDATRHVRTEHPGHIGRPDQGPVSAVFVTQAAAQGNVTRYRFYCRRCAAPVDTTTRPDPANAHCEECK